MSYSSVKKWIRVLGTEPTFLREIPCPTDPLALLNGQVFRIDEKAKPSIILKEDTAVELGPPHRASFQTVCRVQDSETLIDGQITLLGPDLPEARGRELPFGQILWVSGETLEDGYLRKVERKLLISNRLPGYMVRWAGERIWARVEKQALDRGFSFEVLGRNLMAHVKRNFPMIRALEILFVTSSDAQVTALGRFFSAKRQSRKGFPKGKRLEGCTAALDCADCPNQPICERIRELAQRFNQMKSSNEKEKRHLVRKILRAAGKEGGPADPELSGVLLGDLPVQECNDHGPIRG